MKSEPTPYRNWMLAAATFVVVATAASGLIAPVAAQTTDAHHAAPAATAPAEWVDGEVRKVDKAARKITLRHGEIRSLEMPAMTMVFQVKDAAWLDAVKAGDKVRFSAEKSAGGALVVTAIEPAR